RSRTACMSRRLSLPTIPEGSLTRLPQAPIPGGGQSSELSWVLKEGKAYLYKKYEETSIAPYTNRSLLSLIEWHLSQDLATQREVSSSTAWVRGIVEDAGDLRGVLLDVAPQSFWMRNRHGTSVP